MPRPGDNSGELICFKHGIPMNLVAENPRRKNFIAPLHRCPKCTEAFAAAFKKATLVRSKRIPSLKQRSLPPVFMAERWPT